MLFSGTARTNLDPFDEHSTATIWDALDKAEMREAIESLPAGLDADVGDGGGMCSTCNISSSLERGSDIAVFTRL